MLIMARRGRGGSGASAQLITFLIMAAVVIVIIKWLLMTIAILIVPFGIWYLWDHAQQRSGDPSGVGPVDTPGSD